MYIKLTKKAVYEINKFYKYYKNDLKFRIYIYGGGCNGFKYRFIFDKYDEYDDLILNYNPFIISDYISSNYLYNSIIDYEIKLMSSHFKIINPNIKSMCNCGMSFNI